MPDTERTVFIFVCSHLRMVARDDSGTWAHVASDGRLGTACEASVHRSAVDLPRNATALANVVSA